uniref:Uncharacterized protein n=1 Tax=Romanomermis culicivorax TaxID=13658 RepID=A0A915HGU4_ROMCU
MFSSKRLFIPAFFGERNAIDTTLPNEREIFVPFGCRLPTHTRKSQLNNFTLKHGIISNFIPISSSSGETLPLEWRADGATTATFDLAESEKDDAGGGALLLDLVSGEVSSKTSMALCCIRLKFPAPSWNPTAID